MTEELADRIDEILSTARAELEGTEASDPAAVLETDAFVDRAEAAEAVLSESEPRDLLAALGLDGGEDGPESVPAAIATGDPGRVAELRALLKLSALASTDEANGAPDDAASDVAELREILGERADAFLDGEPEAGEDGAAADSGDDLRESLRSALDETREELGLSEFAADVGDAVSDAAAGASGEGDDGLVDRVTGDEADGGVVDAVTGADGAEDGSGADESEDAGAEDGGLVDAGGGSSGRSHLSTMPDRRSDMEAVPRHSTVPDR